MGLYSSLSSLFYVIYNFNISIIQHMLNAAQYTEFSINGKNYILFLNTTGWIHYWKNRIPNPIVTIVTSIIELIYVFLYQIAIHKRGKIILSNFSFGSINKGRRLKIFMKIAGSSKYLFYSSFFIKTNSKPI